MLLENKVAVIYGAGGIATAVARAFIREGARVFIGSRTRAKLDELAIQLKTADTAIVDALDENSVDQFIDDVVAKAGRVDISFNLIGVGDVQGTPLIEMSLADFEQPIRNAVRSTFLTVRAAGRQMVKQGSGVILAFGGSGDPVLDYSIGGFQVALEAVEAMRRQISAELGGHGIRMVTMRTGGIVDSIPEDSAEREEIVKLVTKDNLIPAVPGFADVGNVAAFIASDQARTMTAATVNISSGALIDH